MKNGVNGNGLWPTESALRKKAFIFVAASVLYWISLYLYVPTLPTYVRTRTENLSLVGVVLAQYGLWQTIVRLPVGIAADWWGGRKPFILAGLLMSGVGAVVMGRAAGIEGLLVGRAITGLAAAAWVPLVAAFSSLFPPDKAVQATAALSFAGSGGRVLATSITGSLNNWGGYSLAFFLAAGAALLAIVSFGPLTPKHREPREPSLSSVRTLITRRDVLAPSLLAAAIQYVNWSTIFGFIPVLAERLGATDITQSILVSLYIGVSLLGNLITTAVAERIGERRLVSASFIMAALGLVGAALARSLPFVFVSQVSIGLSFGVAYPLLMGLSIQHVADRDRTIAMGLHQAIYGAGMFIGPGLSGILANLAGIQPMFGITACLCLLPVLLANRGLLGGEQRTAARGGGHH